MQSLNKRLFKCMIMPSDHLVEYEKYEAHVNHCQTIKNMEFTLENESQNVLNL